jgi:hypothetical protein
MLGIIIFLNFIRQAPEKRPEVKVLEFCELPGISLSSLTRRLQKFVPATGKRLKTEHLALIPARSTGKSSFLVLQFPFSMSI